MNVAPKNKKLGFRHFATFGTTFRVRVGHFSIPPTMNVTPKNKKLDLSILQHLEEFLGLVLGWVISAYPPTMNVAPKNKKLDLGILQHLEQLLGLGLGGHFSIPPTKHVTLLGLVLSTGLGLGLSTEV